MSAAGALNDTAQRAAQFQREMAQSQRRAMNHYGLGERPWPNQAPVPTEPVTTTLEELAAVLLRWAQQTSDGLTTVTVGSADERDQLAARVPDLVRTGRVRIDVRS